MELLRASSNAQNVVRCCWSILRSDLLRKVSLPSCSLCSSTLPDLPNVLSILLPLYAFIIDDFDDSDDDFDKDSDGDFDDDDDDDNEDVLALANFPGS